jgi:biotin-(acetyl-CoA carboxylase) ligase
VEVIAMTQEVASLADDRGPLTPEDVLEEIVEEWEAIKEEGDDTEDVSFFGAVQNYFWNLSDEMHDSRGDAEYQRGVVERIVAVRRLFVNAPAGTAAERINQKETVATYLGDILNAEIDEEDVTDGVVIPEVY